MSLHVGKALHCLCKAFNGLICVTMFDAVPDAVVEIIGVRFKDVGKVYYFAPAGVNFEQGDKAIVETARGIECGEIVLTNRTVSESSIVSPLKSIIRKATEADEKRLDEKCRQETPFFLFFHNISPFCTLFFLTCIKGLVFFAYHL